MIINILSQFDFRIALDDAIFIFRKMYNINENITHKPFLIFSIISRELKRNKKTITF